MAVAPGTTFGDGNDGKDSAIIVERSVSKVVGVTTWGVSYSCSDNSYFNNDNPTLEIEPEVCTILK